MSRARDEYKDKVLVINKPSGPTSFDMVDAFRKASGIRKVGHTGTLDPLAEGVLLMCTGRATRASEHFMNLRKIYEFTVRFGVETDTLDAEGRIVDEKECPHIADGDLRKIATEFIGDYELEPPAYSAIKHNGRRMYELARSGEAPEVAKRTVRIHDMQVTGSDLPDVRLRLECSRGTYVRSIARDFGRRFGVPAHIRQLVRTAVGPFKVEDAFDGRRVFDGDLEGLVTLEPAAALAFLPGIVLSDRSTRALVDGGLPERGDVLETIGQVDAAESVRILDRRGNLLAVGSRGKTGNPASWVDSYRLFIDPRSVTG